MDLNEYQALAQRMANTEMLCCKLESGCFGLAGATGEMCDLVRKELYWEDELDREKMADELGDALWYVAEVAAGMKLTLEDVAARNIKKLRRRYQRGVEVERSVNRDDARG